MRVLRGNCCRGIEAIAFTDVLYAVRGMTDVAWLYIHMFDFIFLYFFVCCVLLFCSFCHIVLYIIATHSFIIIL